MVDSKKKETESKQLFMRIANWDIWVFTAKNFAATCSVPTMRWFTYFARLFMTLRIAKRNWDEGKVRARIWSIVSLPLIYIAGYKVSLKSFNNQ